MAAKRKEEAVEVDIGDEEVVTSTEKERVQVDIDYSPKDVVELDAEGAELFFEDEEGRFLELGPEEVQKLSAQNRARYLLTSHAYHTREREKDEPESAPIRVSPRLARATRRIDVRYPKGWREKFHPVWKRTDEVRDAEYEGYTTVKDKEIESFGSGDSRGVHVIGAAGEDELILMAKPLEEHEKDEAAKREYNRSLVSGYDDGVKAAIESVEEKGHRGKAFDPQKDRGITGRFGPPNRG